MKYSHSLTIFSVIIAITVLVISTCCVAPVHCEQLSTVFVLETSDSSAPESSDGGASSADAQRTPETERKLAEDSNTRVITDDSPPIKPEPQQYQPADSQVVVRHHNHSTAAHTPTAHHAASHSTSVTPAHQANHPTNTAHHPSPSTAHQVASSSPAHSASAAHASSAAPAHQVAQSHAAHSSHTAHSPTSQVSPQHQNQQHNSSHQTTATSSHHAAQEKHQTAEPKPTSRRLEEESHLVAQRSSISTRNVQSQQQQQQHQHVTSAPVRHKTTTTAPPDSYYEEQQQPNVAPLTTTPKTEERLLISITSEDDDSSYKPPPKQLGGSNLSGSQLSLGGQNLVVGEVPHKRKPSITISIQDANINKQNGGSSGTPAVILRPSENGQSIVISTVGGSSTIEQGAHNNKYNQHINKPQAIAIVASNGYNQNPNQNLPPYREPVNSVLSGSGGGNSHINSNNNNNNHHHHISTTSRPVLVEDDNSGYNSKPITSTLIEPPRPNLQVNEERPQRPQLVSEETSDYGSPVRPTSRPIVSRPTQDPYNVNNNNNNEQTEYPSKPQQAGQPQEPKYPLSDKNCGTVHETRIVGGDEADPGDFLWMAAIIKSKPKEGDQRPFCGGSLITRRHILTAAHCLENLAPRDVLVRLGSYDFDDSTASSLSADYAIDQFRVPAQYSKKTHAADIAIMRLKTPISPSDNYKTVCMPQPRRSYVGVLGTVTGYGSQSQTFRRAAPKLRQVTVPIWENRKCSGVYKKPLNESFLCAGYEEGGKDACQGDSGGPLMTEGPNERMMIVGVVSHGIGCGSPGYPGVYTRTTTYLDWIEKNTKE